MNDAANLPELFTARLGQPSGTIALSLREQHSAALAQMAAQATRTLDIFSYNLDATVFDTVAFIDAVKQLAIGSNNSRVRILIQEPRDLILRGHRIIELARRVSSRIHLHRAAMDDRKRADSFFIADQTGLIRRAYPERYEGTADFNAAGEARSYLKFFEEAWERSEPEAEFRRLHI